MNKRPNRRLEMETKQAQLLRIAFIAGAITDALALLPMLIPALARLLWGFVNPDGTYRFAMGYGASLMLGWTILLVWASQKPLERRFVAALTILVIAGLAATELHAVATGAMSAARVAPTWVLQAVLVALFAAGYHDPAHRRQTA
jgi:hypothetical protein